MKAANEIRIAPGSGQFREFAHVDEESIVKTKRVFVNRNLKLKSIRTIGFDLDHTLAVYAKIPMETLAFDETKKKLVEEKGYPEELLRLQYHPDFVIRGLVVDKSRGNIIKMDKHKYVVKAYHGRREMSRAERKATYANKRLTIYDTDYRSIDTLFSLPEVDLFAQIIDSIEIDRVACATAYHQIFDDIRLCIDTAHRDGSIKEKVVGNLEKYFIRDPKLPLTLDKLIKGGKKLFLLTNSGWDYSDTLLTHLLNGTVDDYPDWMDYFDLVIIDANKPAFFAEGGPLQPFEPSGRDRNGSRTRIYQSGNVKHLQELLGLKGEEVLYFGDHTHADIMKSKKNSFWRTAMIIEELEREIISGGHVKHFSTELERIDKLLSDLRFQSNMLVERMQMIRETKSQDYSGLSPQELATMDKELESYLRRVIRSEQKITEQLLRAKELEEAIERAYNPFWGQLFKAGRENSRFGDQVEDFACVYASRVSNFLHYPVNRYYQTQRELMPHEK